MIIFPLLEKDMDDFVEVWNRHYIRKNNRGNTIAGRPNKLYAIPPSPWSDCKQPLPSEIIKKVREGIFQKESLSNLLQWMTDEEEQFAKDLLANYTTQHEIQTITHKNWRAVFMGTINLYRKTLETLESVE